MELDNRLCVNLVTTGLDPAEHAIAKLTAWWMCPPPFGDKAFTAMVRPMLGQKLAAIDYEHMKQFGDNFLWVSNPRSPIFSEALDPVDAWKLFVTYIEGTWGTNYPDCFRVVGAPLNFMPGLSNELTDAFLCHGLYDQFATTTGISEVLERYSCHLVSA